MTTYRYQTKRSDEPLRTKLVELAREKPRFGYRRLQVLLRRSGEQVNHKRLHRMYREAGLAIRLASAHIGDTVVLSGTGFESNDGKLQRQYFFMPNLVFQSSQAQMC